MQVELLKSRDRSRKTEVKTNGDVAQWRSICGYPKSRVEYSITYFIASNRIFLGFYWEIIYKFTALCVAYYFFMNSIVFCTVELLLRIQFVVSINFQYIVTHLLTKCIARQLRNRQKSRVFFGSAQFFPHLEAATIPLYTRIFVNVSMKCQGWVYRFVGSLETVVISTINYLNSYWLGGVVKCRLTFDNRRKFVS